MIDMDLFSELRTIYEATLLDPHTYRITIKMKDIIDGKLLREAVNMTMERYIQEFEALPSTALPSTHVPLTIEMSALHGYFFINFIQYFDEYDYFSTFLDQLRQNDIDYDVLNVECVNKSL